MKCIDCIFISDQRTFREDEYPSVRCTKGLWDDKVREPPIPVWYSYGNAVRNRAAVRRHGEACTVGEAKV